MKKLSINFISLVTILFTSSCQMYTNTEEKRLPTIVPAVELKRPATHTLGIIGGVEPVYILPMKSAFPARIDTGAQTTSLDCSNIKKFERDGQKWVSFIIENKETKETHKFEKIVEKKTNIKRINDTEERIIVIMDIKIGNQIIKEKVSLANRDKFDYQALIGRNIINGRALIDSSIENSLR